MKLNTLHQNSYSQLTNYYADLSEPMAVLRRQILETVLCGKRPEFPLHFMGNFAIGEESIPAINLQNTILDVGCANGDNLNIMQHLGFKNLSGIDVASEMVAEAKIKTQLPIHCVDMFEYEAPADDVVFAQALVHLFPKQELPTVLKRLLSMSGQRFYFSTTVHEEPREGLEQKFHVVRYRSRYTKEELLTTIRDVLDAVNDKQNTWRVFYFFLNDCLGKYWINVVFDKVDISASYEDDGIVVNRNFFNKEVIQKLSEELNHFANNKAPANTWLRYDDDDVFDRVENFIPYLSEDMRNQFHSPLLMELLEKCCGYNAALLKDKCNFKPPGKQAFPLHQDAAAGWEKSGYGNRHLTIAISLDDASLENGALQFAPGKHKEGLFSPLYEAMSQDYLYTWNFQPIKMAPGDAVIFDSYLPHYSEANDSDLPRKIIFLTYIDASYATAAKSFFAEKRLRQPPMDERDGKTNLVRNEYGKWVKAEYEA